MATPPWMIYGAYGFTGRLMAAEAVRRGHRPILAGRSEARLRELGISLGLDWKVFGLDNPREVERALTGIDIVLNSAGPFDTTTEPLLDACITMGTSYTDISGELDVYEQTFAREDEVRHAGITVVTGIGFDVVPTDCLAVRAAREIGKPTSLEIAVGTSGGLSPGTMRATFRMAGQGGRERRDGIIVEVPVAETVQRIRLPQRERGMVSVPLGDIASAFRSSGVRNITTYLIVPASLRALAAGASKVGGWIASIAPVQRAVDGLIARVAKGPDDEALASSRTESWVRASDGVETIEYYLEAPGGYTYTQVSAVRAIERLLRERIVGVFTPEQALGVDFINEIPQSKLWRRRSGSGWIVVSETHGTVESG
ncbi:MAG: saccharopine dehydrogenase NADP-binding domain-containing protein [bacterium]|nr:saccharopine dehydrogenase NADP-binding domain-containing protein [Candidatus Kapabacteria bacterium]